MSRQPGPAHSVAESVGSPASAAATRCGRWLTSATDSSCACGVIGRTRAPRLSQNRLTVATAVGKVRSASGVRRQTQPS